MTKNERSEMRELSTLYDIYMPWCWTNTERLVCEVTLRTGKTVTLAIPLGAAVEIEEAGTPIKVIA